MATESGERNIAGLGAAARMMRRYLVWAIVVTFGVIGLGGCGFSKENKPVQTPNAATGSTKDADISSGCWKASDRGIAQGEQKLVGHQQWKTAPAMAIDVNKTYHATLETSAGNIEVEFYPKDAPVTVNNFVCLAKAGYYDNTPFHRIISGFVIQGGDPSGTGRGGPGYRFNDEPIEKDYVKGTLAMANAGPNTNGSQFFICTGDLTNGRLPKNYTIFGKVIGGMDVVDKLDKTPVKASTGGEKSSPIDPVTLNKVTITEA